MMLHSRTSQGVIRAHYKPLRPPHPFLGNEVIVLRHAETIYEVFPDWIERCKLDDLGTVEFHPFDLNMPVRIPIRPNMKLAYKHDPPLSEIGRIVTQIFARELIVRNAIPKVIYSSPTLASVQTAVDIQNFIGKQCGSICVDESLASNQEAAVYWFTKKDMMRLKYNINESYVAQQLENVNISSVANNMRRLVRKVSKRNEIVLVISDSMAVSMLCDIISGVEKKYDQLQEKLRYDAEITFPSMSSVVFSPNSGGKGATRLEPSRITLRPLTSIGDTSQAVFDAVTEVKT